MAGSILSQQMLENAFKGNNIAVFHIRTSNIQDNPPTVCLVESTINDVFNHMFETMAYVDVNRTTSTIRCGILAKPVTFTHLYNAAIGQGTQHQRQRYTVKAVERRAG